MSTKLTTYQEIQAAAEMIQSRCTLQPKIGMILGSGLGPLANEIENSTIIPYTDIPFFHPCSVEGHAGRMILGHFQGVPVVALQGRLHVYEGYPMDAIVFPTRVICALGIETLVLTNAAGGINTRFRPCDLMVIEDHLNLMGDNPLKGPNIAQLGPRFPDMTEGYNRRLVKILKDTADELSIRCHSGVYAGLLGPTYETPAEIRMLRAIGADAVGMSTVPESIAANHLGVQVAGISAITNLAAGISTQKLSHDEVMLNSQTISENLIRLMRIAIPKMVHQPMSSSTRGSAENNPPA